MRVATNAIRRKVLEFEQTVTDKELFASSRFAAHLMDMVEVMTGDYSKPARVKVVWDENPDVGVGGTDGKIIWINAGNEISLSLPTRWLRYMSYIGILAHEVGHKKVTDFGMRNLYLSTLYSGRFFPCRPVLDGFDDELKMSEIDEMLCENDKLKLNIFVDAAQGLRNTLEDFVVNSFVISEFPGMFKYGLEVLLLRQSSMIPSIKAQLDKGYAEYAVMLNTIMQYTIFGSINNLGGYEGPIMDDFDAVAPIIDEAIAEDIRGRLSATNRLLVKLWPYIRGMIEDNKSQQQQTGASDDEQAGKSKQEMKQQAPSYSDDSNGESTPQPHLSGGGDGGEETEAPDLDELQKQVIQAIEDAEEGRKFRKTDDFSEGDGGLLTFDDDFGGAGYQYAADDIARLLSAAAHEKALEALEEELTEELQDEASRVRLGNAHKGVNLVVHRTPLVCEDLIEQYQTVAAPLELLSKKMLSIVTPYLRDENADEKVGGQFSGPYLDTSKLHNPSRGMFYQRRPDDDGLDVAVGFLNDISGSMLTGDRITAARAASLVVYDFCIKAEIPVCVYGHCASGNEVHLFSYAEFGSIDGNDRYRIMDMTPMGCNRDGAALRYMCEKLLKRPENIKLLILDSDGFPNDGDYTGSAAEADLRGIKKEYTNKGITFVAAAIGDDRPAIERIYGKSFMDVSDLKKLPQSLVNVLIQCIR